MGIIIWFYERTGSRSYPWGFGFGVGGSLPPRSRVARMRRSSRDRLSAAPVGNQANSARECAGNRRGALVGNTVAFPFRWFCW